MVERSNADAFVEQENGSLVFAEPHETSERFSEFLRYVQEDSTSAPDEHCGKNVKYAQTRKSHPTFPNVGDPLTDLRERQSPRRVHEPLGRCTQGDRLRPHCFG